MLASENAAGMERLADEILTRGRRLEAVLSENEARVIGADLTRMRVLAPRARRLAAELRVGLDAAAPSAAGAGNDAAVRGDGVITSDVGDLDRLRTIFPNVRLLGV